MAMEIALRTENLTIGDDLKIDSGFVEVAKSWTGKICLLFTVTRRDRAIPLVSVVAGGLGNSAVT
jgi:hypothetical protein